MGRADLQHTAKDHNAIWYNTDVSDKFCYGVIQLKTATRCQGQGQIAAGRFPGNDELVRIAAEFMGITENPLICCRCIFKGCRIPVPGSQSVIDVKYNISAVGIGKGNPLMGILGAHGKPAAVNIHDDRPRQPHVKGTVDIQLVGITAVRHIGNIADDPASLPGAALIIGIGFSAAEEPDALIKEVSPDFFIIE